MSFVKLKDNKNCTAVACVADKRVETSRVCVYIYLYI